MCVTVNRDRTRGCQAAGGARSAIAPDGRWGARGDYLQASGDASAVVVMESDGAGGISVAQSLPSFLHVDESGARFHNPRGVVLSGEPSPTAVGRYLARGVVR